MTNLDNPGNYKILDVASNLTLYRFARIIVKAFHFDFDHAFGFYNNIDDHYRSTKIFELFSDMPDVEHTPGAQGVKRFFMVSDLYKEDDTFLFLFDYGDGWRFKLEFLDDSEKVYHVPDSYYKIFESHGEDPEQYPNYD